MLSQGHLFEATPPCPVVEVNALWMTVVVAAWWSNHTCLVKLGHALSRWIMFVSPIAMRSKAHGDHRADMTLLPCGYVVVVAVSFEFTPPFLVGFHDVSCSAYVVVRPCMLGIAWARSCKADGVCFTHCHAKRSPKLPSGKLDLALAWAHGLGVSFMLNDADLVPLDSSLCTKSFVTCCCGVRLVVLWSSVHDSV